MGQQLDISRLIREYDGQGWHRTGTDVDRVSAEWLAEQVRDRGVEPSLEPFSLSRVDPRPSFVEIDGHRVAGVPLFDGTFTNEHGIEGRLGPLGSDAPIGVAELAPNLASRGPFLEARREGRHRALLVVTRGRRPGLALMNADRFTEPFGPPVLQVSSEDGDRLLSQAGQGVTARLVVEATRQDVEAFNVVATIPGAAGALPPLVVMTPRSGWWHCASERGGGIACWLEVMRTLHEAGTDRDVYFVASSGHELGHLGLEAFIARRPSLPQAACAWIHFGANIGAAQEGAGRLAASDDGLERPTRDALAQAGAPSVEVVPRGTVLQGESKNIYVRGGRYLSLVGGNALFHLESDRWPYAIDDDAIARFAAAFASLAAGLTGAAAVPTA